jgi:hypothetical protein
MGKKKKSKFIGVTFDTPNGKYRVHIELNKKLGARAFFCNSADIEQNPSDAWNVIDEIKVAKGKKDNIYDKDYNIIKS